MKNILIVFFFIFSFILGWFAKGILDSRRIISIRNVTPTSRPRTLEKYSIENLLEADIKPGNITIKSQIDSLKEYTSYIFQYDFNPNLDGKTIVKTTGQINVPTGNGPFPVILMLRGYIDQNTYKTGDGTRNASAFFAKNGFVTIAPDFLGYGGSDKESENIFEARFQTYATSLALLKTIDQLSTRPELISSDIDIYPFKTSEIFIWGHSNGGQVAISLLEDSGTTHPTVLWAPVTKPFPYSILYYTDESDDHGKLLRKELAEFESDYDVEKYSLSNYLDKIQAPIQLDQGTADKEVPVDWSTVLTKSLKGVGKTVTYNTYPGTDHNMLPSWNAVILKDLEFYRSFLKQ